MDYQHHFYNERCKLPPGKVVCIGRNYAEHARELNNPVPDAPIIFMKPATALQTLEMPISWPAELGACHHELEVAVLIGARAQRITAQEAHKHIAGVGIGLDLTLRELQNQLKAKGHPWELAKAFDGSCPVSAFLPLENFPDLKAISLSLRINGEVRQRGVTSDMLTPIADLLSYVSRYFTLEPGDIIMTGTPAGVGALHPGDELELELDGRFRFTAKVG